MSIYSVTHFYRRVPTEQGWQTTGFITQKENDDRYYFGLTGKLYPTESVAADVQNRSLQEVSRNAIESDEAVFITPEQIVYIAKQVKPRSHDHRPIFKDNISANASPIEVALKIQDLLNCDDLTERIPELDVFIKYESLEPLVVALITNIIKETHDEEKTKFMCYLLFRTQMKFPIKTIKYLNRFKAAIYSTALEYFDLKGNSRTIELELSDYMPRENLIEGFDEQFDINFEASRF